MIPEASFEIAGFVGVAFYLGSYAALQAGLIRGSGYLYAALNLAASSLVLTSLVSNFNLWSAIIQISWIVISIVGMVRIFILSNRLDISEEGRAFLEAKFRDLGPLHAHRLIRAGDWQDMAPGRELTREGAPVPALHFLRTGLAEVTVGGKTVAKVGENTLVGEFGVVSDSPAIASVRVSEPARVFTIPAERMRRLIERDPVIRMALNAAIGIEARSKMQATNARVAE